MSSSRRSRTLPAALATAVALALLPGAVAQAAPKVKATGGSTSTFTKVASHPQAAAQPTTMGRTIATLKGFGGKLYSGFGDYGANTGPIAITPLAGTTFAASPLLAADTEAVWAYREIGGRLYAPSIDPRTSAVFAMGGTSGWANATPFAATHAFDVVTLTGTDLWLVGSSGSSAVAWRSLDGGATWAEALRVAPRSGAAGENSRFYGAGVLDGRLYLQAMDSTGGPHPGSLVFDGTSWSEGPSFGWAFTHAEPFAGRLVAQQSYHAAHYPGPLLSFDGSRSTVAQASVYDYAIAGDTVYVLGTDRVVRSSKDLRAWTTVATAPSVARSIGVLDGTVYVGGTDSAVYVRR